MRTHQTLSRSRRGGRVVITILALTIMGSACSATSNVERVGPQSEATEVAGPTPTPAAVPTPTAAPAATATTVPEPSATEPVPVATSVPTPSPTPPRPTPPVPTPTVAPIAATDHGGLGGQHGLTLQWISWEPDEWGQVDFVPLQDGTYSISGGQEGASGDYVTVEGTIQKVSESELLFNGVVTVSVSFSEFDEPCVRQGEIPFVATGERRFWRMQDLLNCDGIITDYVDIYFG